MARPLVRMHEASDDASAERDKAAVESGGLRFEISDASITDREHIYALRHDVYAHELGQHPPNEQGRLTDALDRSNHYIVAKVAGSLVGFVSVTPPGAPAYSLDKYIRRDALPFSLANRTAEVRLLTVRRGYRGLPVALLLMYAAYRWAVERHCEQIIAIGRQEIADLYAKAGLLRTGIHVQSGKVTYEIMHARLSDIPDRLKPYDPVLKRISPRADWALDFPFWAQSAAYHGGAFFKAIGEEFDQLDRRLNVVNADVLDAWYPPSPRALAAISDKLAWVMQTSPPTGGDGLIRVIARARSVPVDSIALGAGSSSLIFNALRSWLNANSRVLLPDPTYGEYSHVLAEVIGCQVDRVPLSADNGYAVDLNQVSLRLKDGYDLLVLVNPNNPTGTFLPRYELEAFLDTVPPATRVWIDETYVDYAGAGESVEAYAARSPNVVVSKSMSKIYALSGARAAYLVGHPDVVAGLRAITPPWAVSLPAQILAAYALQDEEYYRERLAETTTLRQAMEAELRLMEIEVYPSVANFILANLQPWQGTAEHVVERCREYGVFLRVTGRTSTVLGPYSFRLAVRDAAANRRVLDVLRTVLGREREVPVTAPALEAVPG